MVVPSSLPPNTKPPTSCPSVLDVESQESTASSATEQDPKPFDPAAWEQAPRTNKAPSWIGGSGGCFRKKPTKKMTLLLVGLVVVVLVIVVTVAVTVGGKSDDTTLCDPYPYSGPDPDPGLNPYPDLTPEECRVRSHECDFNTPGGCYYIRLNVGAYNLYKDARYYRCHNSCSFCDCVNGDSFNNICGWWDEADMAVPDLRHEQLLRVRLVQGGEHRRRL